jgi:hypothetical protein
VRNVTVGSLDDERVEVTATGPNPRVARALVVLLSGCLVALGESVLRGGVWSHLLDAAVAVGFFGAAAVWVGRPLRGDRAAAALAAGGSWCLAGLDVRMSAIWWPAMAVAVLPGLPGLSGIRMSSLLHRRPAWAALIGVVVLAVAAASRGLGAGRVAEFLALVGATIGILGAVRPREGDTRGASVAESSAYGAAGVLLGLGIALPAALVTLRLELSPAWGAIVGSSLLAAAGACLLVIAWVDPGADAQLRDHVIEIASEPGAGITDLLLPAASARAPQAYSAARAMLDANAAMVSQLELQVAQSRALQRRLVTAADTEREQLALRQRPIARPGRLRRPHPPRPHR